MDDGTYDPNVRITFIFKALGGTDTHGRPVAHFATYIVKYSMAQKLYSDFTMGLNYTFTGMKVCKGRGVEQFTTIMRDSVMQIEWPDELIQSVKSYSKYRIEEG